MHNTGVLGYISRFRKQARQVFESCRQVVVIKLHYGVKWHKDLVLFLLSIAHELSNGGMHMYLLVQVCTFSFTPIPAGGLCGPRALAYQLLPHP